MTAKIHRLRPKRLDAVTEAIQLVLALPLELSDRTRDDLSEALTKHAPSDAWTYSMVNPQQLRHILQAINAGPNSGNVLRVWTAAVSFVQFDTGEITASRKALAETAGTSPQEVSRAFSRLVEIGAVVRIRPGRYAINPHAVWSGSMSKRQEAAKTSHPVQLTLIQSP